MWAAVPPQRENDVNKTLGGRRNNMKKSRKETISTERTFQAARKFSTDFHPAVEFLYFALVLGFGMFLLHPFCLLFFVCRSPFLFIPSSREKSRAPESNLYAAHTFSSPRRPILFSAMGERPFWPIFLRAILLPWKAFFTGWELPVCWPVCFCGLCVSRRW